MNRKELGAWGENQAKKYLENKGYTIEVMNWRSPFGEIDIIAEKNGVLVAVEVKTRKVYRDMYGEPREAVNRVKQHHLRKTFLAYLQQREEEPKAVRLDVIEVKVEQTGIYYVEHIEGCI